MHSIMNAGSAAAGPSADRTLIWNSRHLVTVLREYEDFYTRTGRAAP